MKKNLRKFTNWKYRIFHGKQQNDFDMIFILYEIYLNGSKSMSRVKLGTKI